MLSDKEMLAVVRQRLAAVEKAAEEMLEVFQHTGNLRKAAADALVAALTVDFNTQVICSADMSDEQRAEWLGGEATS